MTGMSIAEPKCSGIAGLGEACRLRRTEMVDDERYVACLRDRMQAALKEAIPI